MRTRLSALVGLATLLGVGSIVVPARAQTSGANQTHDPSRMIESEGKFYVYSTGGGSKSSGDGLVWTNGPAPLPNGFPSWVGVLFSTNQGVWAPDVIFLNGQYYLYYSVAGLPSTSACAIGLLTSPTLNPGSPNYKWTDRGMVVNNPANTTAIQYATIDPAPLQDADGNLWVVWGSGYGKDITVSQLWATRMDNTTGLPLTTDPAYQPPLSPGHPLETGRKEGSYMHYHAGYYYLFYNEGSCCDGTASTYTIWVGRSLNLTGPFSGDRVFYTSIGDIHGPGHMGIYSACGVERFTYHYYPTATSVLGENELSWGSDGWPVAGLPSTTPLTPCGDPGSGTDGVDAGGVGGGSSGGAGGAMDAGGRDSAAGADSGQPRGLDSGPGTSGGDSGQSGATGSGSSSGGGGPPGLDSGAGGGSSSGSAGSGGPSSSGGNSPAASGPDSNAGCSCSLPGDLGAGGDGGLLLAAAGAVVASIRRWRGPRRGGSRNRPRGDSARW